MLETYSNDVPLQNVFVVHAYRAVGNKLKYVVFRLCPKM